MAGEAWRRANAGDGASVVRPRDVGAAGTADKAQRALGSCRWGSPAVSATLQGASVPSMEQLWCGAVRCCFVSGGALKSACSERQAAPTRLAL